MERQYYINKYLVIEDCSEGIRLRLKDVLAPQEEINKALQICNMRIVNSSSEHCLLEMIDG